MHERIDLLYRLGGALADVQFQRRNHGDWADSLGYIEETLRDTLHAFDWNDQDIDLAIAIRQRELDEGEEEGWDQDWRQLRADPPLSWAEERRAELRAMGVTE